MLPRRLTLLGGGFVVVALILLLLRFVVPGALVAMSAPAWRMSAAIADAIHAQSATFESPAKLQGELDAASAQITTLTDENKTLAAQVADLKKLLGTRSEAPPAVLAGVLARPPESPYDTLVIDQGSHSSVMPGALVRGPGGVPVGKVSSVTAASARVVLFSAPGTATDGWAGEDRVPLTIHGAGAGAFLASVPKDAELSVGDTVYVAGEGAAPIGTVVRIDSDPSASAATLYIAPFLNPFSLTWVLVSRS